VGFFFIKEGTAKVTIGGEEVATFGPGDHFGEIALIDDGARTATVSADTEVRCYGLTSWAFRPLVENNPSVAWKLLQVMAKRLRETQQRML
jgi:CRP-like cAMP-binding protein